MPTFEQHSTALYDEGLESFVKGDHASAMRSWQASLQADPSNINAQRGIERIQNIQEQYDPKSSALYRQALQDYLSKNYQPAQQEASQALQLNPNQIEAIRLLQRMRQGSYGTPD